LNKSLILIGLFSLFSGCSMLGGGKTNIPQVKPVEVVTVVKEAPMYHPPLPASISALPVEWRVLTPATMEEYLKDLNEGNAPMNVYYGLTVKGYENLSNNMADIKRYLRQVLSIVDYYKKSDETTEGE